jgi:hypothetical protein
VVWQQKGVSAEIVDEDDAEPEEGQQREGEVCHRGLVYTPRQTFPNRGPFSKDFLI